MHRRSRADRLTDRLTGPQLFSVIAVHNTSCWSDWTCGGGGGDVGVFIFDQNLLGRWMTWKDWTEAAVYCGLRDRGRRVFLRFTRRPSATSGDVIESRALWRHRFRADFVAPSRWIWSTFCIVPPTLNSAFFVYALVCHSATFFIRDVAPGLGNFCVRFPETKQSRKH